MAEPRSETRTHPATTDDGSEFPDASRADCPPTGADTPTGAVATLEEVTAGVPRAGREIELEPRDTPKPKERP